MTPPSIANPRALFSLLVLLLAPAVLAADKSGVSPNSISVPKGPGSIEGLGESFQPSLNTGTANYSLGLSFPRGTAGHQPGLALRYEGGGGNGPLGYGWSLPLPSIQRRTDQGIPTYGANVGFPRADVFINEMREELVPRSDGFWFCENEGAFIRYRFVTSPAQPMEEGLGEGYWEATLPNGTKLEFGLTANGRIEDTAASRVFTWLLERETDTRGNVIEYVHRSFPGDANLNQKYLTLVRYGPGAPPWTHFHFVTFQYEDRPDWFEDGRAGFLVRTGTRLRSIIVGTQGVHLPDHALGDFDGDGTPDSLNRRYDLEYLRYAGEESHWSLLERVTLVGADGLTALPPATFAYTVCHPPEELSARDHWIGAIDEPSLVMDNAFVDLLDLNADGLPDVLRTELGGEHRAWINQGSVLQEGQPAIRWSAPVEIDSGDGAAWNFDLASERTHLADMNGDGLADLVHKAADESVFYFANRGRLAWSERLDMSIQDVAPPVPFGDPEVRTADLDFDKRIDLIRSEEAGAGIQCRIWFNLDAQTYSPPIVVEPTFPFPFSRSGVQIVDCNGDRVPDLARVQPDSLVVAAGLGYGQFAPLRQIAIPDATLDDVHVAKARLSDLNGDGLADLVVEQATPGTCWYWLNLGNYTFSPRKRITDLPVALSRNAAVRWADLNGNGTTDLIYADREATPRIQAVEIGELLGSRPTPNLLTRIENGIGRVTRIEYAPSTRFALEDAAAGRPWPQALPFPVTVVAKVTVSDSLGHEYVTEFRYHDGYYDPVEKQFRGFARVEQIDLGDATAPTLVSRSYFDTGHALGVMKGKLLRRTTETEDGKVFTDETTTWTTPPKTLMTGINGQVVRFAHPTASAKQVLEQGRGTPRQLESESDYDLLGNQTLQANYGIVEHGDRTAFDDERITVTEYALNQAAWIIRLPKRVSVQDEHGAVISRSEMFYDDETFSGDNPGSVIIGNLTLQRDWIDPAEPQAFVTSARTKYDRHGNPVALFDPLSDGTGDPAQGHFRELAYDTAFYSWPIRETVHVGAGSPDLEFQAAYDEGLGTMLTSTDFNGHSTAYGHDALGRLTSIVKPGDSAEFPTMEYAYALAVPVADTGLVNFVETRQLDQSEIRMPKAEMYFITRRFVDGVGRALMTRSEAEPAPGTAAPRVVVTGAVVFNQRQARRCGLDPFFTLRSGSLEELLAFENIEAPDWRGQFHKEGALVSLALGAAHQSLTEYDATLRAIRLTNPDGTFGRTEFEPLLTRSFDENDTDTTSPHFDTPMVQFTDGLGRLVRVDEMVRLNADGTPSTAPQTWTTRYHYDLSDRLTRVADSQNNVKELHYDGLQRKTGMNDPDAGASTNRYDAASNLVETVDAKGQRITYTYDGAHRMLTEDYHDDDSPEFGYHRHPDVVYHYDVPAPSVDQGDGTSATARNLRGVLAYVQDATGEEHTSFDARGRVEWTIKRIRDPIPQGAGALAAYKTTFEYDASDRVTRLIYPDHDQVTYHYNARTLLERIGGGPSGSILSAIRYLPSAQQSQLDFGNGVRSEYAYDQRLRLTHLKTFSSRPGQVDEWINFNYEFDGVSNIQSIHDQRSPTAVALADKRRNSQTFTYDDLYRLTRAQYNPATPSPDNGGEINYRYDRIGNMLSQTSDLAHLEQGVSITDVGTMAYGGAAGRSDRVGRSPNDPPGPHALTQISHPEAQLSDRNFQYDANGNMTRIDGLHCSWDFKNRLVTVEDKATRAEYRYDYTDRRILKRVTAKAPSTPPIGNEPQGELAATTIYVTKAFEVREHDQPTKFVFQGTVRVARITGALSNNTRIQRLRCYPGWNLVSLAITAPRALRQLSGPTTGDEDPGEGTIASAFRWQPATQTWFPVTLDETLPAGTIVWLHSSKHLVLALTGNYADPTNQAVTVGGSFHSSAGFEVLPLLDVRAGVGADAALWSFHSPSQRWAGLLPQLSGFDANFPKALAPGSVLFVQSETPSELRVADPVLRIRYYHRDHLGSSSVITDSEGGLVEETAYYPFGEARHAYRPRQVEETYRFTQQERDPESGLHQFAARFLDARLSRFVSADPKYLHLDGLAPGDFATPQALNLYSYVHSNPLKYVDPTGLERFTRQEQKEIQESTKGSTVEITPDWDRIGNLGGGALLAAGGVAACATIKGCVVGAPMIMAGSDRIAAGITGGGTTLPDDFHTAMDFVSPGVSGYAIASGLGRALAARSALIGANDAARRAAVSPRPMVDPLADTQKVVSKGAQTAGMGSRSGASGVGNVRGPGSGGASGVASVADDATEAALNAAVNEYQAILKVQQMALRAVNPVAIYGNTGLDMAYRQANAIWVSKYGTPPPGNLGGALKWGK